MLFQLHSSDGTGSSKERTGERRTPPNKTLMDFIPPPPSNPPPPGGHVYDVSSFWKHQNSYTKQDIFQTATRRQLNRGSTPREDTYDSVSDGAFARVDVNARPTSRNRNLGGRPLKGKRDDDSQRSSLMMDDDGGSSEADGENSEGDVPRGGVRKAVPRMGISASTLAHSCCEFLEAKCHLIFIFSDGTNGTAQRFRSIPRNNGIVTQEQTWRCWTRKRSCLEIGALKNNQTIQSQEFITSQPFSLFSLWTKNLSFTCHCFNICYLSPFMNCSTRSRCTEKQKSLGFELYLFILSVRQSFCIRNCNLWCVVFTTVSCLIM